MKVNTALENTREKVGRDHTDEVSSCFGPSRQSILTATQRCLTQEAHVERPRKLLRRIWLPSLVITSSSLVLVRQSGFHPSTSSHTRFSAIIPCLDELDAEPWLLLFHLASFDGEKADVFPVFTCVHLLRASNPLPASYLVKRPPLYLYPIYPTYFAVETSSHVLCSSLTPFVADL